MLRSYLQSLLDTLNIRHHFFVMAYAVCAVVVLFAVFVIYQLLVDTHAPVTSTALEDSRTIATSSDVYVLSAAEPVRIRIPRIGVDAVFEEPLGVDAQREIEVPIDFSKVGWYKFGPTPGEMGPAVVLGHVDSKAGPAVFYSLGQLTEGDHIEIEREDGSVAVFAVDRLLRQEQKEFPTALVYSDIPYAGIRLITCSGWYDRSVQRYSHNLIVFGRLIEDRNVYPDSHVQ